MNINEQIKIISNEYDFDERKIKGYLETLLQYPFIRNGSEENLLICLEMIVSERSTQRFVKENDQLSDIKRSLQDTISEMVYRVYQEKALNYLDEDFLNQKRLIKDYNSDYIDQELSEEERKYHGYK